MPKPEVKPHMLYMAAGQFYNIGSAYANGRPSVRINPDGTWVFVDDQDREIQHWDLKLKVGDVVKTHRSATRTYEVLEVDPTRENPYRTSGSISGIGWFDVGIERWEKVESKAPHRFNVGDLVHSERAGGTFRIHEIDDDRRVCRMTDFQGRIMPFDLDYVQGHFKPFGATATTANPFGGSGQ